MESIIRWVLVRSNFLEKDWKSNGERKQKIKHGAIQPVLMKYRWRTAGFQINCYVYYYCWQYKFGYVLIPVPQNNSNILEIFLSSFEQLNVLDRAFNVFIVLDLEYPETLSRGFFLARVSFFSFFSPVYL